VNREESAGWLSRGVLWWLNGLIALGYKRPLEQEDLGSVFSADESRAVSDAFARHWAEEKTKAKSSIVRALRRTVGGCNVVMAIVAFFASAALGFLPPLMLQRLVAFLEGQTPWRPWAEVWVDVVGMLVVPIIASVLQAWHFTVMTRAGTQVRTALTAAIFNKAVVLASNGKYTTGDIVTRISVDATQGQRLVQFALMLLAAPFQVAVALWLIYNQVGVATFAGLGFMLGLTPLNGMVFGMLAAFRKRLLVQTDARVKMLNEVLTGIRVIKLYAWEGAFGRLVGAIREKELQLVRRSAIWVAIAFSLVLLATPILLPIIVFAAYTNIVGGQLDAARAFLVINLFGLVRFPLAFAPMGLVQYLQFQVSNKRIADFLLSDELPPPNTDVPADTPIVVEGAAFQWPKVDKKDDGGGGDGGGDGKGGRGARSRSRRGAPQPTPAAAASAPASPSPPIVEAPVLSGVNLRVTRGQLVAVVGRVGAGKSTLLSGILGQAPCVAGSVRTAPAMAYAPQQAWTLNATLRDNVVFGATPTTAGGEGYDRERYEAVLDACALRDDLKVLPSGDDTEIGERGINLSGGQRARVSLARATYSRHNVVLMDDPLSAVDAHVAAHIFNRAILGMLKTEGRTMVLVTNALQFLPQCDRVVVLSGGTVAADGTYDEVAATAVFQALTTEAPQPPPSPVASADDNPASPTAAAGTGAVAVAVAAPREGAASTAAAASAEEVEVRIVAGGESAAAVNGTPTATPRAVVTKPASATAVTAVATTPAPRRGGGSTSTPAAVGKPSARGGGKLVVEEERATGSVGWRTYASYFRAGGTALLVGVIVCQVSRAARRGVKTCAAWGCRHCPPPPLSPQSLAGSGPRC